jgi:hypothetical protein
MPALHPFGSGRIINVTSPARYRVDRETLRDVVLNPEELSRWLDAQLLAAVPAAERRHRTGQCHYDRADAPAAWSSEGLTAEQVRSLDPTAPQRLRIEATTDRIASRPYRTLRRIQLPRRLSERYLRP